MDLVGREVGNYRVVRRLGAGGMGTVYLCEHPLIGHKLAMKVLHEEHSGDAELVKRFQQEARAAAAIGHENIIEVVDLGTLDTDRGTTAYLMMEYLDGLGLTAWKRRRGMTWPDLLHVLAQCCRALQASHDHGIVHRDLKPENIYVCPRASDPLFVKIMDFGIAKLLEPGSALARTRLGVALGTPAYMSPEQCTGRGEIDGRADIYSLGVVMYELLTGRLPFGAEIGPALRGHMYEAPPPPRSIDPRIPAELEAICLHALEKDKKRRFATMADMLVAINDPVGHLAAWHPAPAGGARARRTLRRVPEAPVSPFAPTLPPGVVAAAERATVSAPAQPATGEHAGELAAAPAHRGRQASLVIGLVASATLLGLLVWGPMRGAEPDDSGAPAAAPTADAAVPVAVPIDDTAPAPAPPDAAAVEPPADASTPDAGEVTPLPGTRRPEPPPPRRRHKPSLLDL